MPQEQEQLLLLGLLSYPRLLNDLRAMMRGEMQDIFSTLIKTEAEPAEELLTVREVSHLLSITVQTVHEYKRQGILPFYKISGRTYLKRSEVVAALQGYQRTIKGGKGTSRG